MCSAPASASSEATTKTDRAMCWLQRRIMHGRVQRRYYKAAADKLHVYVYIYTYHIHIFMYMYI